MYDNYNYPEGADTPDAPWNQCDPDPVEFEFEISYTLTKCVTISSTEYTGGYRDEEGYYERPDFEGNVQEAVEENHLTPLQLIKEYQDVCEMELAELEKIDHPNQAQRERKRHLNLVIASCEGWDEEFEEL